MRCPLCSPWQATCLRRASMLSSLGIPPSAEHGCSRPRIKASAYMELPPCDDRWSLVREVMEPSDEGVPKYRGFLWKRVDGEASSDVRTHDRDQEMTYTFHRRRCVDTPSFGDWYAFKDDCTKRARYAAEWKHWVAEGSPADVDAFLQCLPDNLQHGAPIRKVGYWRVPYWSSTDEGVNRGGRRPPPPPQEVAGAVQGISAAATALKSPEEERSEQVAAELIADEERERNAPAKMSKKARRKQRMRSGDAGTTILPGGEDGDRCADWSGTQAPIGAGAVATHEPAEAAMRDEAAASRNRRECMKLLLGAKASVDCTNDKGSPSLFLASVRGHAECIQLLLHADASVNLANHEGVTSLWLASQNGHDRCVKLLLDSYASVDEAATDGSTSLWIASKSGHEGCVKLLLEAKASVKQAANDGATSLMVATMNVHEPCVKLLLEANASVEQAANNWPTSLMVASERGGLALMMASHYGHARCAELLLQAKARVNQASNDGQTSLLSASLNGHDPCVKLLLGASASVDDQISDTGETSLLLASRYGRTGCVKLLLDATASVNLANSDGDTSLVVASKCGKHECVELLLTAKADLNKTMSFVTEKIGFPADPKVTLTSASLECFLSLRGVDRRNLDSCVLLVLDAKAAIDDEAEQSADRMARLLIAEEEEEQGHPPKQSKKSRRKQRKKQSEGSNAADPGAEEEMATIAQTSAAADGASAEQVMDAAVERSASASHSATILGLADVGNITCRPAPPESTLGGELSCIVCFMNAKTHAAVPCGHQCVCEGCSKRITECPICRGPVAMWMQVRMA